MRGWWRWAGAWVLSLAAVGAAQGYDAEDFWRDAQVANGAEKSEESRARVQWWRDARYGMFIHWNMSSLVGGEISWSKVFSGDTGEARLPNERPNLGEKAYEPTEWRPMFVPPVPAEVYDELHKSFYPGSFDADAIAGLAKRAGMKYIVITAKHHDGFAMWDSATTDYDIMSTPFKRDIIGELAEATRRAGLKFGFYYSQRDWHHPDYNPEGLDRYNEYQHAQIRELLTKYGEISVIFFDERSKTGNLKDPTIWNTEPLFKMIYELQPNVVINNRCSVPADYSTPEQRIGRFQLDRNWESCMTFELFWSFRGFHTNPAPAEKLLETLVRCATGDGNLLMNVGPLPTGQIDPREVERLEAVGAWLDEHGESIYGTTGGPIKPGEWGGTTREGEVVYLHVLDWEAAPGRFPAMGETILNAELVGGGGAVGVTQDGDGFSLDVAPDQHGAWNTVVKLTLAGSAMGLEPVEVE